jgi:hypothetical protein
MKLTKFIASCILMLCVFNVLGNGITYYSQSGGDGLTLSRWNTIRLGGGSSPGNFTSNDIFVIQGTGNGGTSPHAITTSAAWTITGAASKIQIENGATLTATFIVAVPNFQVDNGGFYVHNAVSAISQGVATDIPGSTTRVFGPTSTVEIQKWANGANNPVALPTISSPGWGNLIINVATLGGSWNQTGNLTSIQGNFTVLKSGGGTFEFRFTASTDYTGIISGNVVVSSGAQLAIASSGAIATQTINGNITINTGGIFSLNTGGSGTVFVTMVVNGSFNLADATSEFHGSQSSSGSWAMTINGNLNISDGIFNYIGSQASGKTYTLNLGGNFNQTGGSFGLVNQFYGVPNLACSLTFTGGSSNVTFLQSGGAFFATTISGSRAISFFIANGKEVKLLSDFPLPPVTYASLDSFIINTGGILNCQSFKLSGYGNFILKPGGILKMGSPAGISVYPTLTGNIQNIGTGAVRTFSKGASYEYNGSVAQSSGLGLPDSILKITLNNSVFQTVTLQSKTLVKDTISLQKGFLATTTTNIITLPDTIGIASPVSNFNTNGGVTNIGWERSFIKGPIAAEIKSNISRWLPVGKIVGTDTLFAPAAIKTTYSSPVTDTVEYFRASYADTSSDHGQLDHISSLEYWKINSNVNTTPAKGKVTLSWRPTSLVGNGNPLNDAVALSTLVVSHYFDEDGSGSKPFLWHLEGADATVMAKGAGSTVNYGTIVTNLDNSPFTFTDNSPYFTLGSRGPFNLLPLKLLDFSGYASTKSNTLKWITSEERNVAGFDLQKSADGINFVTIQTIRANNSVSVNQYGEVDINPLTGINYYRLKINDLAQKISYSPVIKIKYGGTNEINLYPNPVKDNLTINHHRAGNLTVLKVVSVSGAEIIAQKAVPGQGQSVLNVASLPSGFYMLKFINGNEIINKAFYKL